MPEAAEQTGQNGSTEQNAGQNSGQQSGQQAGQQQQQQQQATNQPGSSGQQNTGSSDWERQRQGLIAETQRERQERQRAQQQMAALQAQYEQAQKRIQALAGVNPKSEQEAEDEQIRDAFRQKFPHLADLTAEDIKALREMRQQQAQLSQSTNAMWQRHATQVMNSIHERVAERLGGDVKDLNDKQKATLKREYVAFIEENQLAGKDYIRRHENGDETLFDEFVENYLGAWQEPIRRSVTSTEANRPRPLPSGKGRSIGTTAMPKIDFKNDKAIADAAVQRFKELGGSFGG